MFHNDPLNRFDLDCMRLMAIQNWASTVQRTYSIDIDIVDLAGGEACRRYQDLENRLKGVISPSLEAVHEAIEAWAIWQALDLQASRQDCIIDPDGIDTFTQDLEQILEHLTTPVPEVRFIL